jgi:hypothetical protein
MCCTGLAPRQAQHTLLGNNCMAIVYLLALQLLRPLDAAHCRHAACVLSVFRSGGAVNTSSGARTRSPGAAFATTLELSTVLAQDHFYSDF